MIQMLPAPLDMPRVATGAVQFGDDWPGLFIRGDNALALMISIEKLNELLANNENEFVDDHIQFLMVYANLIKHEIKAT